MEISRISKINNRNENSNPVQVTELSVVFTVLVLSFPKNSGTRTGISTGFKPLDKLRASSFNTSASSEEAVNIFKSTYLKCAILIFHIRNQKDVHWQER